jgi:hypothetical protein
MEEDVSMVIEHPEKRQIILPRGSRVVIDMVSMGTCQSNTVSFWLNSFFNSTFTVRKPN